jgi:hypothetical protein
VGYNLPSEILSLTRLKSNALVSRLKEGRFVAEWFAHSKIVFVSIKHREAGAYI